MIERNGLQVHHLENAAETEPAYYMQQQQSLAKVLSPGRYQHGVSRNKLFDYTYGVRDLIICNRGIDEFVRWESEIKMLKVDLPGEAFRAVANESGAETVEIRSSTQFEDKRVDALVSAIQAEEEVGGISGRLYMDSIAQALASALVQLRGNLKRKLPRYHCGLTPIQLSRVKELVYGRIDREVSLLEMASAAGLSINYFNQMFRRTTGQAAAPVCLECARGTCKRSAQVAEPASDRCCNELWLSNSPAFCKSLPVGLRCDTNGLSEIARGSRLSRSAVHSPWSVASGDAGKLNRKRSTQTNTVRRLRQTSVKPKAPLCAQTFKLNAFQLLRFLIRKDHCYEYRSQHQSTRRTIFGFTSQTDPRSVGQRDAVRPAAKGERDAGSPYVPLRIQRQIQ
jgi:AraC family transcriptional regulator